MNPTDCTGYACPPEHSVPAHDVIVNTPHLLAGTGAESTDLILLAIGALSLIALGAMAIAWVNRQERERRFWRDEAYRAEGREYDGRQ